MEKYEYLTGEDLGYKPDVIQKAKFEYSPLGKVFNKGLDESDKKEGLLKRLKNIEDKSGEQLKMIGNKIDNQLGIKSIKYILDEELSQEAKNIITKLNNQEKIINDKKLSFKRDKYFGFDFCGYESLKGLFKAIYYRNISIDEAERIQEKYEAQLNALERYILRNPDYVGERKQLLNNAKNFHDGREMIINAFKDKIFPLNPEKSFPEYKDRDEDEDEDGDKFYSPKEVTSRSEITDFGFREMFED